MKQTVALVTLMLWPVIPIMWVPVHLATDFFRKLGRATYLLVAASWAAAAYIIFLNRQLLVAHRVELPPSVSIAGLILLAAGTLLHVWTAALLTLPGITGVNEIARTEESRLVDSGPFSLVRHPTYLAHTLIFLGIFLFTGVVSTAVLTIADFVVVNGVIIPLEERELLRRFGSPYKQYMEKVPRVLPRAIRKH